MKLAIMQPYFMPYIGYISLIKHTDEFVLFDTVQFIRHGWIERNRILKQSGGWQYIQIPLIKDNGRDTVIKDVRINNTENWKQRILAQLQHYKKIAPYYFRVINLLKELFVYDFDDITHLNQKSLQLVCDYLGFQRDFPIFSEMNLSIEEVNAPDEWALNICKAMNVSSYLNPIGGSEFFDRKKYEKAGVDLKFQQMRLDEYDQKRQPFEAGLSIIDVMMFNSPEDINVMMDHFELL